jgi:nucleoside-diphosphate-sugar epimerase
MNTEKRKCIISGTSGFVGSHIKSYFLKNEWEVYELKHTVQNGNASNKYLIPYSLGDKVDSKIFDDVQAFIHCAYDFKQAKWKDIFNVNVNGSIELLKAGKSAGIEKIIFISSIAAFDDCKSMYGRAKLEIEKEALKIGATIIRPGLVYGQNPGGMFGTLNKVTSVLPVIPVIGNGKNVMFLIHITDLCKLVYKLATGEIKSFLNPIIAAHEQGKTFREMLSILLNSKNKKAFYIPIPYSLVFAMLKVAEGLGLQIRFRSDSLISMMNYDPNPKFDLELSRNIQLRDFNAQSLNS